MTYTFATLDVPPALYDFVVKKLYEAGYGHAFEVGVSPEPGKDCGPIDMHGIALTRADVPASEWCCEQLAAARAEIVDLERSVRYYIEGANEAGKQAAAQRERRLALEQELPFVNMPSGPVAFQKVERPHLRFFGRLGHCIDLFLADQS
jgi:hypothetical protein